LGLRIELADENPFSKYGESVLRVFHGPYVDEYYRPEEVIAYGITAARGLSCYAGKKVPQLGENASMRAFESCRRGYGHFHQNPSATANK
jgi:hypothetical protein